MEKVRPPTSWPTWTSFGAKRLESLVRMTSGRRLGGGARPVTEPAREAGPVEAETVLGEERRQVSALVRPDTRDVPDAVREDAVPVAVVGAEAREILAHRADRLAEIRGRGVVRLEAQDHLAAAEEDHRVVVERAVLSRAVGLREDALEVVAAGRVAPVLQHQPLPAVAIDARAQPVAVGGIRVVEEDHRVLPLVGVGVDDAEAVVHG